MNTCHTFLALGAPAFWKYRAIYLDGDEPFDQWSDAVSIAAGA